MQNVSNTGKGGQTNPKEINVTKPVDNGETLTWDNESISDESLPKTNLV